MGREIGGQRGSDQQEENRIRVAQWNGEMQLMTDSFFGSHVVVDKGLVIHRII